MTHCHEGRHLAAEPITERATPSADHHSTLSAFAVGVRERHARSAALLRLGAEGVPSRRTQSHGGHWCACWLSACPRQQPIAAVTAVVKNVARKFCLDSNTGKNVYTLDCNCGSFQRWTGI